MDGRDRDRRLLAGFLAGELDPAAARRWDEHLLACEQCWRAVREDRAGRQAAQLLRQPAPPRLADRVAFAVEVAAAGSTAAPPRARPGGRLAWWRLAGAAALVATVTVTLTVLLPGRDQHARSGGRAAPVQVGRPETVTAGGQKLVMRTWRLGRIEAVVAVSGQPFPMPPGAASVAGAGMAWSRRLGQLGLYCLNGHRSELVAAPVPIAVLAALAARLPPR